MVVRTLEAIFRRPLRLLILFVLLPLISIGTVYFVVPHIYKSTATLWALQPFESIGLATTASNVPVTPAQTQADALSEQDIQTHLDNIEQEIAAQGITPDSFFKVVDSPLVPGLPEPRSRDFIIAAGIGLCVAIIACALLIVILVRRDHAVHTARDLQKVTTYPVIMQVPRLTSRTVPLLIKEIDPA